MPEELEPTPLPDAGETVNPLAETLDELTATVESASDRAAATADDMQAAAAEVTATAEEVTASAAATAEEATAAAAATVEEVTAPIAETGAVVAAAVDEGVELPVAVVPAAQELRATTDEMPALVVPAALAPQDVPPVAAVPPLPVPVAAAVAEVVPGEVTSDDRLISALSWLGLVLLQLPLVNIVILLADGNKNRPFQRHHAVQGLGFWVAAIVYEIVATLVFTVGSIVTLGLGALCLWVIFFLPHLLALVYAWQAWQGKELNIPVVTKFMKQQGWLA